MNINSNPKIVVLPSFYPMKLNYVRGNFFEEQTRLLKRKGADVTIIFNENRSLKSFTLKKLKHIYFQTQFELEDNLPVLRRLAWNVVPTKFALGQSIWIKSSIKLVEIYIKKYGKPDLFHVHCAINAGSVALYFKKKYNIPYLITEHSSFFLLAKISDFQKSEVFNIYDKADKVIAVSNSFKSLLSEKIGFNKDRIDVIANYIDTDFFNPNSPLKYPYLNNENVMFTVCHHEYNKRLDRLIDSFELVLKVYPNWILIIGGSGSQTEHLKIKVRELHRGNNIIFTGFLSKEEVRDHMNRATLFVLPSDVETFGVVLIEAMAMGIPVVATASGGPQDIITEDTGVIVDLNVVSLADGLLKVINNLKNYDKNKIRSKALKDFSGENIADKYVNLYSKVVNSNGVVF
jgi:glycosyltransferase involved in cell wall biosynthesis